MEIIYTIPTVIALLIKGVILWRGREALRSVNILVVTFLISVIGANLLEISSFTFADNLDYAFYPLCTYYFALTTLAFSILGMSIRVMGKLTNTVLCVLVVLWLALSIPLFLKGVVIDGVESIDYSLTRIKGSMYFIGPVGFLLPNIFALAILVFCVLNGRGRVRESSALLLAVLSPIIFTELIIIFLMANGAKVNMAIFLSLTSIISVYALVYGQRRRHGFSFLAVVHGTDESDFMALSYKAYSYGISMAQATTIFEYAIALRALKDVAGDVNKTTRYKIAAETLGSSPSSLSRKISQGRKLNRELAELGVWNSSSSSMEP